MYNHLPVQFEHRIGVSCIKTSIAPRAQVADAPHSLLYYITNPRTLFGASSPDGTARIFFQPPCAEALGFVPTSRQSSCTDLGPFEGRSID